MARLTLVNSRSPRPNTGTQVATLGHRASSSEGQSARQLLEAQGHSSSGPKQGQYVFSCPFHEGPGKVPKDPNFYLDAETSMYTCHSASCGEKGNLRTLERYFGIDVDDNYTSAIKSRELLLKEYEAALTPERRKPFYEHGLNDVTIERFRLGFQEAHLNENGNPIPDRYVIPYLEGRRPKMFRYYQPDATEAKWKYTWEKDGEGASVFNAQDAMGDTKGRVFICEGEQKAMLLVQMGYAAVGLPGATQWKDEWQALFTHARHIFVCFDNDNPEHPRNQYDKIDRPCQKCTVQQLDACRGHNPGQDAAARLMERIGWRAKNVKLPLPEGLVQKTDVNDFFMRDGHTNLDFNEIATGKRTTTHKVESFTEISLKPPEEATFLIEQGILPAGGRLLIAGKPKVGKSIFADNLALSLAAGIPFLGRFKVDHPSRVLLLDRELSKWSLFNRINDLMQYRPGYRAAADNLLIDHDHLLRLDQPNAFDTLLKLVEQNGAEVCILDTAYKFLTDVEKSTSLMKAFDVLDRIIHETGVSFVLTHHHKKSGTPSRKENNDVADPDNVAGSFLWTGWPNSTILLNYLKRSVENPFNSVCTFTAFRDAAAPEPLALYRERKSIAYTAITDFSHEDAESTYAPTTKQQITTAAVVELLLELCPTTEADFMHIAQSQFGSEQLVRPFFLDAMASGGFEKTTGKPPIIKFKDAGPEEQSWEAEHGLKERPIPDTTGAGFEDVDMFDAASLA